MTIYEKLKNVDKGFLKKLIKCECMKDYCIKHNLISSCQRKIRSE